MIRKFTREISSSQSQFKAQIERKYVTQQCSYNLPIELEDHLRALGAIAKANPSEPETNAKYFLTNGYLLVLGANIIAAIGESYKKVDNRVVFTHTEGSNGTSKKIQLKKTDFKNFGKSEYKWFVELYEKNLESTLIVVFVDDEKKTVTIDLELTPYFFSGKPMPEEEKESFIESENDVLEHNLYGIHIKKTNDTLSDDQPHICIGWSALGDLSFVKTKDELVAKYDEVWPDSKPKAKGQDVGQIWKFIKEIKTGDYVIYADNSLCHIGRIVSDYYYDPSVRDEQNADYVNNRRVEWLKTNIARSTLSKSFHNSLMTPKSLFGLNDYRAAVVDLLSGDYVREEDQEFDSDVLSLEELIEALKKWEKEELIENRTSRLVAFGFKYAESIQLIKGCSDKLLKSLGFDNMGAYIDRGRDLYFAIKNRVIEVPMFDVESVEETQSVASNIVYQTPYNCEFPHNRIAFGAPGTGKSFTLNKEKDELIANGGSFERVTFHPDYSYANFVGTYKPVPVNDEITYSFVAGPFIRTWIEAIKSAQSDNPKPYVLLIEEINRANVAAVFGDVFQLLDRDENGVSEYPIQTSKELREYLARELKCWPDEVATIRIPSNMFIWATMNSADQGVFPMDTAFKRRWDFRYIGIDESQDRIKDYTLVIADQKINWNALRTAINARLTSLNINEDKLIGPYFINEKTLKDNKAFVEAFKSKVIMYLFEDAGKQRRGKVFYQEGVKYSDLCQKFMSEGVKVFNPEIYKNLIDTEEA